MTSLRRKVLTGAGVGAVVIVTVLAAVVGMQLTRAGSGPSVPNQDYGHGVIGKRVNYPTPPRKTINYASLPAAPTTSVATKGPKPNFAKIEQMKAKAAHNPNAPTIAPQAPPRSPSAASGVLPNTPTTVNSGGLNSGSCSDCTGQPALAVGNGFAIESVWDKIAVYNINESTNAISFTSGNIFKSLEAFMGVTNTDEVRAARAFYDPDTNQFFVLAEDRTTSTYLIATAPATNPNGTWAITSLNLARASQSLNVADGDPPGFGFDAEALYVTGNYYTDPADFTTFDGNVIGFICKAFVISGSASNCGPLSSTFSTFQDQKDDATHFAWSIQPVLAYGTPRVEFFINTALITDTSTSNIYHLWSLSNPLGLRGNSTSETKLTDLKVGNFTYAQPPDPAEPGGGSLVITYNNVLGQPIWRDGSLYFAIDSGVNNGSGSTVTGVIWIQYQIGLAALDANADLIKNAVGRENGQFVFSGTTSAFNPSLAVDAEGDVCYTFNFSSATINPTVAMNCRRPTAPRGTQSNSVTLVSAPAPWNVLEFFGPWTATAWDPASNPSYSPACMIGVGMYANNTTWSTEFGDACFTIGTASA